MARPANRSVLLGGAILAVVVAVGFARPRAGHQRSERHRSRRAQSQARRRAHGPRRRRTPARRPLLDGHRQPRPRRLQPRRLRARVSLVVGVTVALVSAAAGLVIGLIAGYVRALDGVVMRVMDGLMAIQASYWPSGSSRSRGRPAQRHPAIVIPEVPRVVRLGALARALDPRGALRGGGRRARRAHAGAAPTPRRANTLAPLIVQARSSAPRPSCWRRSSRSWRRHPTETPTWGNIMAEGARCSASSRTTSSSPGIFLAVTVLAVNMLGDGLRDQLDPRVSRRL